MDIGDRNDGVSSLKPLGALCHFSRKFVAKDTRIFKIGLLPGEGMEIRAANADSADA